MIDNRFVLHRRVYCRGALLYLDNNRQVYFEKIRVLKAGVCLYIVAWNNGIGLRFYFVGFLNRSND